MDINFRTLLEAGEVPLWTLTRLISGTRGRSAQGLDVGPSGTDQHCGVLSSWARGVVTGLSLREGERKQFKQRFALENPLDDAAILELSRAVTTTTMPRTPIMATLAQERLSRDTGIEWLASDNYSGGGTQDRQSAGLIPEVRPGRGLQRLCDPDALPAIPDRSINVLVCDATWLSRISPHWLASNRQGQSEGRRGNHGQVQDAPEARPDYASSDYASSDMAHELQRNYLLWLLGHFKRIVRSNGICVLAYQHMLPSAWVTLGESLVASGWLCCGAMPFPAPVQRVRRDCYLFPRALAWDALLICRPKVNFARSGGLTLMSAMSTTILAPPLAPPTRVVVDSTCLEQASLRVMESTKATEKRRLKMGSADRLNLWRAVIVAGAREVGPADPLLVSTPKVGPRDPRHEHSVDPGQRHDARDPVKGVDHALPESVLLVDALRSEPDWERR